MLPTPPAAPVTSTSPASGSSPCSSSAIPASMAAHPAVPPPLARPVGRPCGSRTRWLALPRASALVEGAGALGFLAWDATRRAGELHCRQHMHRDAGGADRMALGLEPARWVDRKLAGLLGPALLDRARAFALGCEPHGLVD